MNPQESVREKPCGSSTVQTCKNMECHKGDIPPIVRSVQLKYKGYYRIVGECVLCGTFQSRFWFTQNISTLRSPTEYPHVRKFSLEDTLPRFIDLVIALR